MATAKHESDVVEYGTQEMASTEAGATYENKVFYNVDSETNSSKAGTTYKNCIFYNSSIRTGGTTTFENCQFIGEAPKNNAPIDVYDSIDKQDFTVTVKNCTFTQTVRGVAVANSDDNQGNITVIVDGCTFNGTTKDKFAALQIANPKAHIEFKNNTVNALGNAPASVRYNARFFTEMSGTKDNLTNFTFSGNTVSGNIPESKYVDLAQHKEVDFNNEALKLFKAGLK